MKRLNNEDMALIKCSECGHEVSDKASVCPNCGCPIQSEDNPMVKETSVEPQPQKKGNGKKWAFIAFLLCLLAGGGYFIYTLFNGANDKDAIVELTPDFIEAVQKYEKLGGFSDGYAAVCKDEKWGYINTKGKEVVPCQYSDAKAFHEGLAAVQKEGKWGYVDAKGREVIPTNIEAEYAGRFSEGLAFIYINDNEFSVIDTKGNSVSKGNCDFSWYLGPDVEESFLPYYFQGKLYVALETDKFAVYDTKGNKVSEVSQATKDELERQNKTNKPYTVFTKENGDNEDYQWYTNGLKDENGKEVIPAIYDGIIYDGADEQIEVNNGVVLVILDEIEEGAEVVEGFGGEFDTGDYKHYYGYADLKGNDTFSKELKKRCEESKKRAANQLFQQEVEESWRIRKEGPDWLQGAWRLQMSDDHGNSLGYMYTVFNHGNCKTYLNGELTLDQTYTVDGDMLSFDKGHYQLDSHRQIVMGANGQEMQKVSNDTSYRPSVSSSTSQSSSSYNSNGGNSNQRSYRFSSAPDVIGYLADKTFYNGNRRLRIRPNGVWLNDYCATGAPNVERWESYKALIRAFTATGQRLSFFVDPINGQITDETGDVFKLR